MVLPPKSELPVVMNFTTAAPVRLTSIPKCVSKRSSSIAINAFGRYGDISVIDE